MDKVWLLTGFPRSRRLIVEKHEAGTLSALEIHGTMMLTISIYGHVKLIGERARCSAWFFNDYKPVLVSCSLEIALEHCHLSPLLTF